MCIDSFIDKLAETAVSQDTNHPTTNQYAHQSQTPIPNQNRRDNLRSYLQRMTQLQPRFMLVGEAPGYQGARLSGIPFVSPDMLTHLPHHLGTNPMALANEWPPIQKEPSATMMWETLGQITAVPLLWNAFPFHPHKPNNPQSNRKPTSQELAIGRPFLHQLHTLFNINTVIAVGNTAAHALTRWDIPHEKIRHPSYGGKADFQAGLFKVICGLKSTDNNQEVR